MTFLLSLPMELRLGLLFVLGAVVGGQVNRGVYRLAWDSRDIGPWSAPPRDAPPRRWFDRVPIFGWLGLAREAPLHGTGYWLRPLLIELFMGLGFAALYVWETGEHHVPWAAGSAPVGVGSLQAVLHAGFIAHLVLISLMAVATFIDLDEKTIPDEITVPGALAGLLFAAVLPASLLPVGIPAPASAPVAIGFLEITSPQMRVVPNWPDWLNGPYGLAIALVCFAAWCFAILPRTWWTRSGPLKTVQFLIASIIRQRVSLWILAMLIVGCLGIACVWGFSPRGSWRWQALLSALVGMVFGGGLIWMVRAIGSRVLAKEAMGFGDVTLMAMIGAFVGWQPSLIIFFLAPIAGLVIALTQWMLTGRKDIAYGPFLCLATLVLLVGWGPVWNRWGWPAFQMGWLIVAMLFVCLLLMGAMLAAWRAVSR